MATNLSYRKLSLEQLGREVTCGICQEHYTEPKALPCLHYYCKQCILRLALRSGKNEPFCCPECRSETTVPEGGVDELKSAFFVERFKSMFSTLEQARDKMEVSCEACNFGAAAESFCRQCSLFICNTCVAAHQAMTVVFKGHQLTSIQDITEGRMALTFKEVSSSMKCHIHDEELKVYCFDCHTLICRDCTVVDHRDHRFQFCAVAAPEMKEKLLKGLEPLRQVGDRLSRAVEEVKSITHEVEAQGEAVAQTINTSFDELVEIVEKRRRELLEEAGRRVREKVGKLTAQEKTLSLASAEVQSVVDYTERCVGHSTDNEVMSMHTEIKYQVEHVIIKYDGTAKNMELEEVDMGVEIKCVEDLEQLCNTNAVITQLPIDLTQCRVKSHGLKTAEVNKMVELTMTANILSNGKPARHQSSIDCYLKCLYNSYVIKCDVDQCGPGEYRIQFTPEFRGRHCLTVLVDGKEIADSPFSMFVSIHPTQLQKPVNALYDVNVVVGIAMNSLGEMVVGRQDGVTLSLYKNGKLLQAFRRHHLKIDDNTIVEVAVDHEDYIYFTLFESSTLVKTNRNGEVVKKAQSKQNTGNMGVAVVGEEVMVCPCLYKGTIMIYNRDLKYARKIVGKGMGEFRDVSCDTQGNIFVSDWDMQCIRVFSHDGNYLHSFNLGADYEGLLIKIRGICVAKDFVYVCAEGGVFSDSLRNNRLHVFTTTGEYVTVIGSYGFDDGEFFVPYSVDVDGDGFVHVSDNIRIQTF